MVDHDFGNLDEEGRVVAVMLDDVVIHVHKDPEDRKKERNVTDQIQLLSFTCICKTLYLTSGWESSNVFTKAVLQNDIRS